MRTLLLLMALVALLAPRVATAQGKLLLTYVSHNEDNYPYLTNPAVYYNRRPAFVAVAQQCQARGVAWNMGNDHVLLRAVIRLDTGTVLNTTGGRNVLRYINEEYGVEMDPHTHEQLYWHPDVAYLYDSMGVAHTNIMGGYAYSQPFPAGHTWMDYQDTMSGPIFPNHRWLARALWGAAVPGHVNDPKYYGVWKPDTLNNFLTHNPARRLANIGGGCNFKLLDTTTVAQVLDSMRVMIDALRTGAVPAQGFYTASLFSQEASFSSPAYLNKLYQLFDSINVWRDEGLVEWVHLSEVIDRWEQQFNSQPWAFSCGLVPTLVAVPEAGSTGGQLTLYPNPVPAGQPLRLSAPATGRVLDAQGRTVRVLPVPVSEIPTEGLSPGIYILHTPAGAVRFGVLD